MKKPITISNETEALSENIHRHDKWLPKQNITANKKLSPKMYDMF
jgi:hypothetical protein